VLEHECHIVKIKYLHHYLQTLVQLTLGHPTSVVTAIAMYMHLIYHKGKHLQLSR